MATNISLPPAAAIEAAANELRTVAEPKRLVALNKAQYDLLVLQPQIVRVSGGYLMPSTSRAGLVHRVDDLGGCDCEAGRAGRQCRHAVAIELVEAAQQRTMSALTSRAAKLATAAEAKRLIDECFA